MTYYNEDLRTDFERQMLEEEAASQESAEQAEELEPFLYRTREELARLEGSMARPLTKPEQEALVNHAVMTEDAGHVFDAAEALDSHYEKQGRQAPDADTDSGRHEVLSELIEDAREDQAFGEVEPDSEPDALEVDAIAAELEAKLGRPLLDHERAEA